MNLWRSFTTLSFILLCCLTSAAQTRGPEATTPVEINILGGARLVKFTLRQLGQELKLEVFNYTGELIYDSGAPAAELHWNLHDNQSQPLPPGLYAYSLSLKASEAAAPRKHFGHLIIEQGNDQVWLTATCLAGFGTIIESGVLPHAHSSERSIVDAIALPSGVPSRETNAETGLRVNANTLAERAAGTAIVNGTVNRVAKFAADGTSLIDSIISEVSGNVGIGTTTPQAGFDYRGSTAAFYTRDIGPTNFGSAQSALQLGVSNLGARNFGVGPSMLFHAENSAGAKSFLGRVSAVWENPTAGAEAGALFFQVRANNGDVNALTERMRITASGNMGIGTPTPAHKLDVAGTINTTTQYNLGGDRIIGGGGSNLFIGKDATGFGGLGGLFNATALGVGALVNTSNTVVLGRSEDAVRVPGNLFVNGNGRVSGDLTVEGNLLITLGTPSASQHICINAANEVVDCSVSSARYKKNITALRAGLAEIERLRPVNFTWKTTDENDFGLIAEEVAEAAPLLAAHAKDGTVKGVNYDKLGVVLVNAVKEQQAQIRQQQKQLEQLLKANQQLRHRLTRLERQVKPRR